MPDLSKMTSSEKNKNNEPIVKFSYDNTPDETDGAMKSFQKRFSKRRGSATIVAYSLLFVAVIVGIVFNPTAVPLYFAAAFCGLGLFYSLTDQRRTRKRVMKALEDMNPEEYCCAIYHDKIELETVIKPKVNEVNLKIDEDVDDEIITPLKTVFRFGEDLLNFSENEDSLLLIYNRRQIYCFPKRCLSAEDEETIRGFLIEKLESD
ncbi:MAG: hypothetical protein K2J77_05205 [Oscillospiraceae bacterium]|nr:hypothetical protein [Oscillospiraceae bacterium]